MLGDKFIYKGPKPSEIQEDRYWITEMLNCHDAETLWQGILKECVGLIETEVVFDKNRNYYLYVIQRSLDNFFLKAFKV